MLRALPSLLCPIGNENVESHHEPEGADEQISGGGGLEERSETIIAFQRVLQQNPSRETMVDSIQSRVFAKMWRYPGADSKNRYSFNTPFIRWKGKILIEYSNVETFQNI
jgi:hypothetical protein